VKLQRIPGKGNPKYKGVRIEGAIVEDYVGWAWEAKVRVWLV
jgi:hypothetical protein